MASIERDYEKLKEISIGFTEETLKTMLKAKYPGKDVQVLRWDFGDASVAKGDNYLSTLHRLKVTGTVDEKQVEVSSVIKVMPKHVGRRKSFRCGEFFGNEIAFYTKVISKFEKFVKEKNQLQVLCIPRFLAAYVDGENDFIALEDVGVFGYTPIGRHNSLNYDQCTMILKALARFHAISFAHKDQKKDEFEESVRNLRETYYTPGHWNWYRRFLEMLIDIDKNALAMEYPGSEAEKKFCSYKASDLFQKAVELCDRKYAPTSVVSEGDSWIPNFLTRETTTESEALILDFQLSRCASPILDLSVVIYACTEKSLWDSKFDELLKFYHDELCNTISLLGSDPKKLYPWNTFMDEVKQQFIFGLIFSMEIIPMCLLDETEAFDVDSIIKDDNAVDIADVWILSNLKTQNARRRYANIVVHATERGFL